MAYEDPFSRAEAAEAELEERRNDRPTVTLTGTRDVQFRHEMSALLKEAARRLQSADIPMTSAYIAPIAIASSRRKWFKRAEVYPNARSTVDGWPILALNPANDQHEIYLFHSSKFNHDSVVEEPGHLCLFVLPSGLGRIAAFFRGEYLLYRPDVRLTGKVDEFSSLFGRDALTLDRGEAFTVSGLRENSSMANAHEFESLEGIRARALAASASASAANAPQVGNFMTMWALGVQDEIRTHLHRTTTPDRPLKRASVSDWREPEVKNIDDAVAKLSRMSYELIGCQAMIRDNREGAAERTRSSLARFKNAEEGLTEWILNDPDGAERNRSRIDDVKRRATDLQKELWQHLE